MVQITNGKDVLTVTHNAFDEVFKRAGYTVYADRPKSEPEANKEAPPLPPIKPISQWTRKELLSYFAKQGAKADGKTDDLRRMVLKHMNETAE
jgi:hypothetical protein